MSERSVRVLDGVDWYEYPAWYDVLHWPGTEEEALGLEAVAQRFAGVTRGEPIRFLEPACGTARHLRALAELGHCGVGLDLSSAMLAYGRDLIDMGGLGGVDLVAGDMSAFGAGVVGEGFDVAFCLANSVRHLPSDEALVAHLRCVGSVLREGGVYALGMGLTAYGVEDVSEDVWTGERGGVRVTQVVQYEPGGVEERSERVISQLCVVEDEQETHVSHGYALRSYDCEQWKRVLTLAGFEVVCVVDDAGVVVDWWDWESGAFGYGVFVLRAVG